MNKALSFFIDQHYHKRMSFWLYVLFFVVVMAQWLLMSLVVALVGFLMTGSFGLSVMLWLFIILVVYFAIGVVVAQNHLKYGGMSVAKKVGAVRLFVHEAHEEDTPPSQSYIRVSDVGQLPYVYRRYYEFAAQMALASGVAMPRLYVLASERAVNAFVAGFHADDTVLVITQGALETLSHAELYGLLGHEFGHLVHKDASLNLKMYAMLISLGWVYEFADVVEARFFGKFDKDYHHTFFGVPLYHEYADHHRQRGDEALGVHLLAYLWLVIPMVVLRLIGAWGMLGTQWLINRLNHQREYLADATSVQLTRSFDVVGALERLRLHQDSRLDEAVFSTYMGHFLFADEGGSHPRLSLRIARLQEVQMVSTHADDELNKAHKYALAYPDDDSDDKPKTVVAPCEDKPLTFESVPEVVVDGKLYVGDWLPKPDVISLYPQRAPKHEAFEAHLAQHEYLNYSSLKAINFTWQIIKDLRALPSTLFLYECVCLCRHTEAIDTEAVVDLWRVYLPCMHMDTPLLRHKLPSDTLQTIARHDRHMDGLLVQMALVRLAEFLKRQLLAPHQTLLDKYRQALDKMMGQVRPCAPVSHAQQSFGVWVMNDKSWHGTLQTLHGALMVLSLCQVVNPNSRFNHEAHADTLLRWLGLDGDDGLVALFAFVGSAQDNSLALMQYDRLTHSIARWCRMLNIKQTDAETLIALMYQLLALNEADWLIIMAKIGAHHDRAYLHRVLEVLYTAMLYDGKMTQLKYDILALVARLWQVALPTELQKIQKNA